MSTLGKQIDRRAAELEWETDRFGPGPALSSPSHISSSRLTIFTNNVSQAENLDDPDVPIILSGLENALAEYSSTIVQSEGNYEVIKKFKKSDYLYWLLVYDKKKKSYHLIERKHLQEYSENMSVLLNNERLDKCDVGDKIKEGETITCSNSFDTHGNYRMGKNLNTAYVINLYTLEDGVVLMNGAEKMMRSTRCKRYRVKISDNEVLLNMYGDGKKYKAFPEIGDKIKDGILVAKRENVAITSIAAMNDRELSMVHHSDTVIYGSGRVIDVKVYTNKTREQYLESAINKQMIDLYDGQLEFYRDVYTYLKDIITNSETDGYTYTREVSKLYAEARDIISSGTYLSTYGENIFGNTIIEFTVMHKEPVVVGSKIVGMCGNKGVVTKIMSKKKSWHTDDGRPIHRLMNALGVVGRLNPTIFGNLSITDASNKTVNKMIETPNIAEKLTILFDFLDLVNKGQSKMWKSRVKEMTQKEKEKFIKVVESNGIHVFQHPVDNVNILDMEKMYDHVGYERCHIKFPDNTLSLYPVVVAPEYTLRMKQDPIEKFSARGRGTINPMTQLPSRSSDMKHGTDVVSNTAVQFGKFEHEVLCICKSPWAVALFMAIHSTSLAAMDTMNELYYKRLDEDMLLDIIRSMSNSNKKNFEIITAWLTLVSSRIKMTYLEDRNWGIPNTQPEWVKVKEAK